MNCAGPGRDTSILIVDDDQAVRSLLETYLGDQYDCTSAASAAEAAELLGRHSFDLVTTDITMPDYPTRCRIDCLRKKESPADFP